MTGAKHLDPRNVMNNKLPSRDWIILPILSLLTISIIAGSTELVARAMFPESSGGEDCLPNYVHTPGIRGIPHCVCWGKGREDRKAGVTRFNSSGYMADQDFGPKSPGVYRIVLIGSSVAMKLGVLNEKTHTPLLATELSGRTGHPVELYNEALPGPAGFPESAALRLNDALAAEPDLILWVITRSDINYVADLPDQSEATGHEANPMSTWQRIKEDLADHAVGKAESELRNRASSLMKSAKRPLDDSIGSFLIKHFLYESQSLYLKQSLHGSDDVVGYLKAEPSLKWQNSLKEFDEMAGGIESRAKDAGVPLALVYVPSAAPTAMVSMGRWPVEYDPYTLGNSIRTIIERHGGAYVDILPDFRTIPNPVQYYLPVDGHPNQEGQLLQANLIAKKISSGIIPGLRTGTAMLDTVKATN